MQRRWYLSTGYPFIISYLCTSQYDDPTAARLVLCWSACVVILWCSAGGALVCDAPARSQDQRKPPPTPCVCVCACTCKRGRFAAAVYSSSRLRSFTSSIYIQTTDYTSRVSYQQSFFVRCTCYIYFKHYNMYEQHARTSTPTASSKQGPFTKYVHRLLYIIYMYVRCIVCNHFINKMYIMM